ncbi:tyrosine-type recombinase/integrase [Arthrobacter rhombi]|uniref:tyrosine-type recombinase/integrase n=1 Tax=Arthrobacter rhombi TaxID=71253 RepID=UPI003FCF1827
MNGPRFTSALGPELERYVAFKNSMGIYCDNRVWYLRNFDRYCTERGLTDLDRATVEGWVSYRISCLPNGRRSWMSYIRGFGRWERLNGDEDAYVLSDQWRSCIVRSRPYLLTNEEITRFFDAATRLDTRTPWRWQGAAFFALMHSCGLRTCEARRLTTQDVNMASGSIDVLWSKGNRSRQLLLTDQIVDVRADCDRSSRGVFGNERAAFFVSATGDPVTGSMAASTFHRIWDLAGLPQTSGEKQPRPYDFRHHFAYANIKRWMAESTDVNVMLPYLARYMGHVSVQSTYYYIHTSPDFMSGYADLVHEGQGILPEVGFE